MRDMKDSLIWVDSGTYEYSTRFSIFEAKFLEQDLGSERVEKRVTGARLSKLFDEDVILFQIFLYFLSQDEQILYLPLHFDKKHYAQRYKIIVRGLLYQ